MAPASSSSSVRLLLLAFVLALVAASVSRAEPEAKPSPKGAKAAIRAAFRMARNQALKDRIAKFRLEERGEKREKGFYTTRFGKRSSSPLNMEEATPLILPPGRAPSQIASVVEGLDENRMPVSCVYAGFRNMYVCDKDEPWSTPIDY